MTPPNCTYCHHEARFHNRFVKKDFPTGCIVCDCEYYLGVIHEPIEEGKK